MRIPGDVIVFPAVAGRWLIHNVRARTWLAVDGEGLEIFRELSSMDSDSPVQIRGKIRIWDLQRFSSYDGLFADPTRIVRDLDAWPEPVAVGAGELLDLLADRCMIARDPEAYTARFAPKTNLLDRHHLGNFHEQLGQHLLVDRRERPDEWWMGQKFTPDGDAVGDNLYKAVQERSLRRTFEDRLGPGTRVVDLGCGTGYYTRLMGATGATVLGIDPNEEFLKVADGGSSENVRFVSSPIGCEGDLDWVEAGQADFVFMIDALLFYFVPPSKDFRGELGALMSDVRRILKPDGRFVVVDPHGVFFLRPWMGDVDRPFTILTEYRTRSFSIVPDLGTKIEGLTGAGFAVTRLRELYPDPAHAERDPRGTAFAAEFPLWWVIELAPFDR